MSLLGAMKEGNVGSGEGSECLDFDEDGLYGGRGDPVVGLALSAGDGNCVGHEAGNAGFDNYELGSGAADIDFVFD